MVTRTDSSASLHRRLRRHQIAQWLKNGAVLFGVAVLLGVGIYFAASGLRDKQGQPLRYAEGVITAVRYGEGPNDISVSLTMKGQTAQAAGYVGVYVGQRVQVAYRIGKSGSLHVEGIKQPLTKR